MARKPRQGTVLWDCSASSSRRLRRKAAAGGGPLRRRKAVATVEAPPALTVARFPHTSLDSVIYIATQGWFHLRRYFIAATERINAEKRLVELKNDCTRRKIVEFEDTMKTELDGLNGVGRMLILFKNDVVFMQHILAAGYTGKIYYEVSSRLPEEKIRLLIAKYGGRIISPDEMEMDISDFEKREF